MWTNMVQLCSHLTLTICEMFYFDINSFQLISQTFHGLLYENENTTSGIREILEELHKFVPYIEKSGEKIFQEQGNVGDQLSVERAINCLLQVSNGFTAEERLEGLHFEVGDFHAGMKFLQVCKLILEGNESA